MLSALKNAYARVNRTRKDDLFSVTVWPAILVLALITTVDAVRAILRHRLSDLFPVGLFCFLVVAFLYLWWHRNKNRDPYAH